MFVCLFVCLFVQYKDLKESELPSRTLWLTVWDWDRLGKNEFLGEVKLPLVEVNLEDSGHKWYPLKDTVS